ncbi:MAG: PQQ-binding-like beta-propeller repeat protein [Myxococcales bacterium]|nr:PQQ-binding-like beta-propeller repeat protein [Myxococcales bacterium]MCB9642566.1 PQQ-binding-like beta-propeller repeat protein [Myxococcales bacterium]
MTIWRLSWLILGWMGGGLWVSSTSTCAGSTTTRAPQRTAPIEPKRTQPTPPPPPSLGPGVRALLPLSIASKDTHELLVLRVSGPKKTKLALWRWNLKQTPKKTWETQIDRWQPRRTPSLQRRLLTHDAENIYIGRAHNTSLEALSRKDGRSLWQYKLPKGFDWSLYLGLYSTPQGPLLLLRHQRNKRLQRLLALSPKDGRVRWDRPLPGSALRAPRVHQGDLYLQQPGHLHRIHLKNGGLRTIPMSGRLYQWGEALWGFRWEGQSRVQLWSRYDTQLDQLTVATREGKAFAVKDFDPNRVLVGLSSDALWIGNNGTALPIRKLRVLDLLRDQKKDIPLPKGYAVANFYDTWGQIRPNASAWHELHFRFLPLWLRGLADPLQKRLMILDLQKRSIHWLSKPHRIKSPIIAGEVLRDGYNIILPLPWKKTNRVMLLFDARRGTFRSAWQVEDDVQKIAGDFPPLHPDQLHKGVLYAATGSAWWSLDLEAGRFLYRQHSGLALRSVAAEVQKALGTWPTPEP